jgi:hypothetical protein
MFGTDDDDDDDDDAAAEIYAFATRPPPTATVGEGASLAELLAEKDQHLETTAGQLQEAGRLGMELLAEIRHLKTTLAEREGVSRAHVARNEELAEALALARLQVTSSQEKVSRTERLLAQADGEAADSERLVSDLRKQLADVRAQLGEERGKTRRLAKRRDSLLGEVHCAMEQAAAAKSNLAAKAPASPAAAAGGVGESKSSYGEPDATLAPALAATASAEFERVAAEEERDAARRQLARAKQTIARLHAGIAARDAAAESATDHGSVPSAELAQLRETNILLRDRVATLDAELRQQEEEEEHAIGVGRRQAGRRDSTSERLAGLDERNRRGGAGAPDRESRALAAIVRTHRGSLRWALRLLVAPSAATEEEEEEEED